MFLRVNNESLREKLSLTQKITVFKNFDEGKKEFKGKITYDNVNAFLNDA